MGGSFGHGVWFRTGLRDRLLEAIDKISEGLRIVKYTKGIEIDEGRVRLSQEKCQELSMWIEHHMPFDADTQLPIEEARELRSFVNLMEKEASMFAGLVGLVGDEEDEEDRYLTNLKKEAIQHFRLAEGYFCQLY